MRLSITRLVAVCAVLLFQACPIPADEDAGELDADAGTTDEHDAGADGGTSDDDAGPDDAGEPDAGPLPECPSLPLVRLTAASGSGSEAPPGLAVTVTAVTNDRILLESATEAIEIEFPLPDGFSPLIAAVTEPVNVSFFVCSGITNEAYVRIETQDGVRLVEGGAPCWPFDAPVLVFLQRDDVPDCTNMMLGALRFSVDPLLDLESGEAASTTFNGLPAVATNSLSGRFEQPACEDCATGVINGSVIAVE